MDYYEKKRKANAIITQLAVNQDENYRDIVYHIADKFGFGEKIVKQKIEQLVETGHLKIKRFECQNCNNSRIIYSGKPIKPCSCGKFKYKELK